MSASFLLNDAGRDFFLLMGCASLIGHLSVSYRSLIGAKLHHKTKV